MQNNFTESSKKNRMLRSFVFAVVCFIICISMFVGTTFAWSADSVSSGNNKLIVGNLEVELYYGIDNASNWEKFESTTELFKDVKWQPGTSKIVYFKVVNSGTVNLDFDFYVTATDTVIGKSIVDGSNVYLSQILKYSVFEPGYTDSIDVAQITNAVALNSFYQASNSYTISNEDEDGKVFAVAIFMPDVTSENDPVYFANCKSDSLPKASIGITVRAKQATGDFDSFGSDYDKDSAYANPVSASVSLDGNNLTLSSSVLKKNGSDDTLTIPAGVLMKADTLSVSFDFNNDFNNDDNVPTASQLLQQLKKAGSQDSEDISFNEQIDKWSADGKSFVYSRGFALSNIASENATALTYTTSVPTNGTKVGFVFRVDKNDENSVYYTLLDSSNYTVGEISVNTSITISSAKPAQFVVVTVAD